MNIFQKLLWQKILMQPGMKYMEAYESCDPQAFLDEMQEELDRRMEEAAKYQ